MYSKYIELGIQLLKANSHKNLARVFVDLILQLKKQNPMFFQHILRSLNSPHRCVLFQILS